MFILLSKSYVITYVITYALTFILVWLGFFCLNFVQASSNTIVISEIMIGMAGESKHEYIKIYNLSSEAIVLDGWTLKKKTKGGTESNLVSSSKMSGTVQPNSYFVIAHPEYSSAIHSDLEYSGSSYSIASHNTVLLYDDDDNLVDKVGYGEAGDYENIAASNPESGESIVRINNQDTDDNSLDFKICNFIGESGDSDDSTVDIPDGVEIGESQVATSSRVIKKIKNDYYKTGAILINELVSDPEDDEFEWVELYNNTSASIDLAKWYLEISSGARTYLKGSIGLDEGNYVLFTGLVASMKNLGDEISLRDSRGNLIDQVIYGNCGDNMFDDNALAAPDPLSLARLSEDNNSLSNKLNYLPTYQKTPGEKNIIINQSGQVYTEMKNADCPIRINEVFPWSEEAEDEFIEIINDDKAPVLLDGYYLQNSSKQIYFLNGFLASSEIISFNRDETGLVLLNQSDNVSLYNQADSLCQLLKFKAGIINQSWAYATSSRTYVWTKEASPGKLNRIIVPNRAPIVNFDYSPAELARPTLFETQDTYDPEGNGLQYSWNFGDGFTNILANPEHTFFRVGEFEVVLWVSDGELEASSSQLIIIKPSGANLSIGRREAREGSIKELTVAITEVVPNPEGSDSDGEWLELFNYGTKPISLFGWSVDDGQGGSAPFDIGNLEIAPQNYIVLEREETKLAFNNTSDSVRLFAPGGQEIASTTYKGTKEGLSWAQDKNGKWQWTTISSPGAQNKIQVASSYKIASPKTIKQSNIIEISLDEIRSLPLGTKVKTKGVVAVLPGVFAKQYFYITGSPGIQVYSYKQDFPKLNVGDKVVVRGELSQNQGELRLKTSSQSDIIVNSQQAELIAKKVICSEVDICFTGELLKVRGELIETKGANMYVDDGEGEVLVYVKANTGIKTSAFAVGDELEVTGILISTATQKKLQPRSPDDIKLLNRISNKPEVLGVDSEADWVLAKKENKSIIYLTIVGFSVILLVVILKINYRKTQNRNPNKGENL